MKILYIGVHSYKNESNWRTESFVANSFTKNNIKFNKIDYRSILKSFNQLELKKQINKAAQDCDLIFLQRGEGVFPDTFSDIKIPIIFWSSEPINRNKDVDILLKSNIFSWIYVHTHTCINRIKKVFPHLIDKVSVLHNAVGEEKINIKDNKQKYFAIFNRTVSLRRRYWLFRSRSLVKIIKGRYGELYYQDLRNSSVAVNVHYSSKSIDDFETGIFEAMACGCVIVSERLPNQTILDLGMKDAIIEVDSPKGLKKQLICLKNSPKLLLEYQTKTKNVIKMNTWTERVKAIKFKFEEILSSK